MIFALFAMAALSWLISILFWIVSSHPSPRRTPLIAGTAILLAAGVISIIQDLRSIILRLGAPDSGISISINDVSNWYQLRYSRSGSSFLTANELHIPVGSAVTIDWHGPNLVGWSAHDFLDLSGRTHFIARNPGIDEAWLFRLWPAPRHRRLRIVAESPPAFEQWYANQVRPATQSSESLFTSCGCSYCHVIRGVAEKPWKLAPDLTHFAVRHTIAATSVPNRRGFLAGWIVDSRGLQPSSEMPPNRLDPVVLHQLLKYLESLR